MRTTGQDREGGSRYAAGGEAIRSLIQSSIQLIKKTICSFYEKGAITTFVLIKHNFLHYARRYLDGRFDRRFGVDTSGRIELENLNIDSLNKVYGVYYEPTPFKSLRNIFSTLPSDASDFIFIDFGSGKGRTLLYASNYNFKRIIGLEFAKDLHLIAQNNIRVYRNQKQRCYQIESICVDATEFELPLEKTIAYFFNPFDIEVTSKILNNIESSYRVRPRKIYLVYYRYYERLGELAESSKFLRMVYTKPLPWDFVSPQRRELRIYETIL